MMTILLGNSYLVNFKPVYFKYDWLKFIKLVEIVISLFYASPLNPQNLNPLKI